MPSAKDIIVKPISSKDARRIVKKIHYSGKVVNNSTLHLGVFLDGNCEGVMQFGSPLDKRKMLGLVEGTGWNEMLELNRMAFSDVLPRNSESRALGVAFRLIKKNYPQIKWVLSFSDATQCGDGVIYRASGFVLTGIKENNQIWQAPTGDKFSRMSLTDGKSKSEQKKAQIISRTTMTKGGDNHHTGAASMKHYIEAGFKPLDGFQIRYVFFIDKSYKERLTVPVLPFSKIDEMGAGMYKGIKRVTKAISGDQLESGGAVPTNALHIEGR